MTPPAEPPIFEIPPSVTVVENEPIFIQIAASRPERGDTAGLEVYVDNLPSGGNFSRGRKEGDRWIFTPADFGEVELELPPHFSGRLDLEITAVADGTSRRRSLVVDIQSTVNTTDVVTTGVTGGTLAITEDTPAATGETTVNTGETPRATGETTTITRETPVNTREMTVSTGETPGVTGETTTITRETPVNTGEIPAVTEETPEIGPTTEETPDNNGRNFHYKTC